MYEILTISSAMISWQWDYKGLFKSCEDCLAVADDGDTLKEQGEVLAIGWATALFGKICHWSHHSIAPLSGEGGRAGNISIVVTAADDEEVEDDKITGDRD